MTKEQITEELKMFMEKHGKVYNPNAQAPKEKFNHQIFYPEDRIDEEAEIEQDLVNADAAADM